LDFARRPLLDTVQGTVSRVALGGAENRAQKVQIPNPNAQVNVRAANVEVSIADDLARIEADVSLKPAASAGAKPGKTGRAFHGTVVATLTGATPGLCLGAGPGPLVDAKTGAITRASADARRSASVATEAGPGCRRVG
jgi:hypothetical protein